MRKVFKKNKRSGSGLPSDAAQKSSFGLTAFHEPITPALEYVLHISYSPAVECDTDEDVLYKASFLSTVLQAIEKKHGQLKALTFLGPRPCCHKSSLAPESYLMGMMPMWRTGSHWSRRIELETTPPTCFRP
jgi:hypothetical protein